MAMFLSMYFSCVPAGSLWNLRSRASDLSLSFFSVTRRKVGSSSCSADRHHGSTNYCQGSNTGFLADKLTVSDLVDRQFLWSVELPIAPHRVFLQEVPDLVPRVQEVVVSDVSLFRLVQVPGHELGLRIYRGFDHQHRQAMCETRMH